MNTIRHLTIPGLLLIALLNTPCALAERQPIKAIYIPLADHYAGIVAWYSKDVLPWPNGHVECIAIAQDKTIAGKREALQEVIRFVHKAGEDIEQARREGGAAMKEIAAMIRKHIPQHNEEAIIQSLRPDLNVINYRKLNNDEAGLKPYRLPHLYLYISISYRL